MKSVKLQIKEVEEVRQFALEQEFEAIKTKQDYMASEKDKWKVQGKLDLLHDLFHFIKEL